MEIIRHDKEICKGCGKTLNYKEYKVSATLYMAKCERAIRQHIKGKLTCLECLNKDAGYSIYPPNQCFFCAHNVELYKSEKDLAYKIKETRICDIDNHEINGWGCPTGHFSFYFDEMTDTLRPIDMWEETIDRKVNIIKANWNLKN